MTNEQRLQTIHDLASARLRNLDAVRSEVDFEHLEHDLKEIVRLSTTQKVTFCTRCPFERTSSFLFSRECKGFTPRKCARV